jgi:hypothetical protein
MRPGPAVLASFGAAAAPVSLPGGQGTTWRAGDIVLKPVGDPRAAHWTAEVYRILRERAAGDFRVPEPVRPAAADRTADGRTAGGRNADGRAAGGRNVDGRAAGGRAAADRTAGGRAADGRTPGGPAAGGWVVRDQASGAWAAWRWLPGEPADWVGLSPCWPRLVPVSRAFHAALAGLPRPPWLGRNGTPWTVADQVAWGERNPGDILASGHGVPAGLSAQVRRLLAALRPVRVPDQLVHGDLSGNVLFAEGQPPAVIDFSPYWRPAGLAVSVAAVDALTWSGADPGILAELDGEPDIDQLLARAHIGRLVTEMIMCRDGDAGLAEVERTGEPVTALVLARLAVG